MAGLLTCSEMKMLVPFKRLEDSKYAILLVTEDSFAMMGRGFCKELSGRFFPALNALIMPILFSSSLSEISFCTLC